MAQSIVLSSGSILNGNPITLAITPTRIVGCTLAFHRVIVEVECGATGGQYEVIKMTAPVANESDAMVYIDISSALRIFRDSYEYTPNPTTYPIVKFNVRAYDEYMLNGVVHPYVEERYYPTNPNLLPADQRDKAYLRTIFGAFSDIDRLLSTGTKGVRTLSTKPTSSPQLVAIGESFVYAVPYSDEELLTSSSNLDLAQPQSRSVAVSKSGLQTLGYQSVYALPSQETSYRHVIRFVNSFGVLESVSIPRVYQKRVSIHSDTYAVTTQESFSKFSRAAVRKQNNRETWTLMTDPLTEEWLYWYTHELLMTEHAWILVRHKSTDLWVPVTLIADENITILDRTKDAPYQITIQAELDINGSPLL